MSSKTFFTGSISTKTFLKGIRTETFLTGSITFMPEVSLEEVQKIAGELSEYTGTYPRKVTNYDIYEHLDLKPHSTIVRYYGDKIYYGLEYEYVNWASHINKEVWNDMMKYLTKHAKKIDEVNLLLFYLNNPDSAISIDHEGLMELRIKQVSKQLLGEDEDEH